MIKTQHPTDYLKKEGEVTGLPEKQQNSKSFQPKSRVRRQYNPDDTNIAKLFLAIREHKTGNPKINKISEIIGLLDLIGNINDVDLNDNSNTPLHVAVSKGHEDIVKLLIDKGADIEIANSQNQKPLDIAERLNRQNIVQILKQPTSQSQQKVSGAGEDKETEAGKSGISDQSNSQSRLLSQVGRLNTKQRSATGYSEVNDRLEEFVNYFVKEFEAKLHAYHMVLEGEVKKAGKFSDTFSGKTGKGIGGAIGGGLGLLLTPFVGPAALRVGVTGGAALGEEGAKALGNKLGESYHRNKVINFPSLIYYSQKKENKADVRKILIEAGFDIFQSFEMQFMRVTTDQGHEGAMRKLAEDATNRAISYLEKKKEGLITEGVILGESKIEPVLGVPIPTSRIKTPGFEINYEYKSSSEKWYTASLYEKVGLVMEEKTSRRTSSYHERKDGKSRAEKYGYRRLFISESWDKLKEKYKPASIVGSKSGQFTDYQYVLSSNNLKQQSNDILEKINLDDKDLGEERIKKILEEARGNIIEVVNVLKRQSHGYADDRKILVSIETNLKNLKVDEYLKEFEQHCEEAKQERQEIAEAVDKGREENRENFDQLHQKLGEIHSVVVVGQDSKQEKKAVWFDVRNSVTFFTALTPGRQEKLDQITNNIQKGIVVISGLGGVGKSELAIKYARNQYGQEDSVVWINAETHQTIKESFHRLYKKLGFKIKDKDEEEKSIEIIVGDIYEYFANGGSLFIFDNAEKYTTIEKFLPLGLPNKPNVLVTSLNNEWKSARVNIETVPLGDFTNSEAIEFVKTALEIKDDSKNVDITNLVRKLHNVPLALQQAVDYIKDMNEEFKARGLEFGISDYLEKYEQAPRRMLNTESVADEHTKTIFKTLETTIDKVKENKEYGQQALDMLNIMSYFAQNNIPEKIFLDELASSDQEKLVSITRLLKKHSIVGLEQGMLTVRGLVQQVVRLESEEKQQQEEILEKALRLLKEHMVTVENYIPHITSAWNYASKYDKLIETFIVDDIVDKPAHVSYFHLIAESSNREVVDTILSKIEDSRKLNKVINTRSDDKKTPLHYAAQSGNEQVVKLLIEKKANVDTRDRVDNRPLHIAAKNGYLGIVKVLLDTNKVNVNAETSPKYKFTPLHFAARNGHLEIVNALLDKGAEVHAETKYKYTPLHLAAENGHFGVVSELLKNDKVNIDAETERKLTPLHLAAKNGYLEVVEALLKKGASVNAQDTGNFTPLHLAALNGHSGIVKLLIDKGARVDAQTTKGNTPLHLAAENDHVKVVEELITRNTDIIDVENEEGKKASDLAIKRDNLEVKDYIRQQTFNRRPGTSGISGQLYEIQLLMLFLMKGLEKTNGFHLATNVKEAGDFDDVVFKYKDQEKSEVVFLQAKHRENPEKDGEKITLAKLFSESEKGDFNLKKYFNSYRKIKQQFSEEKEDPIFGSKFEDSDFVIYTNALPNFGENDKSIEKIAVGQGEILNLEESGHYYKLRLDGEVDKERIDILQYTSDCKKLARELVNSIFSDKELDMNEGILRNYHIPLAEKVIQRKEGSEEGELRDSFLGDEDNPFRSAFFEEVCKRSEFTEKSEDELKSELKSISIKLPGNFGRMNAKKVKYPESLPGDLVSEGDIKEFLSKVKLFVDQPNESKLSEIIKRKIKTIYGVAEQDIDSVFSDAEYKVRMWWQTGKQYLTEGNRFFQDAARVSIKFDVRDPVPLFTGRQGKLQELHGALQNGGQLVISQMASVTGLGGVGKSELARKYISEHSKDYDGNVIWINADNYLTIVESFRRLAQDKLGISTTDENGKEKEIKLIVGDVYNFFAKRHRKSLFVFDNAEKHKAYGGEDEGIDKFLPSGSNKPSVLITSRDQEWGTSIAKLQLDVFTEEEAVEFIRKALGIEDGSQESEIKNLAQELQCLPLALQQAVAYINKENQGLNKWSEGEFTISNYLELYKEKASELLSKASGETYDRYTGTVLTTWQITIDKIKQRKSRGGVQALEILDVIAYLAPDKIPVDEIFSKLINDEEVRHSAVELLDQYSMANLDSGKLNIHGLVQQVTRLELKVQNKEEKVIKKAFQLSQKSFPYNSDELKDYDRKKQLLPHYEALLSNIDNWLKENYEKRKTIGESYITDMSKWMSEGYGGLGNPERQKELLERALSMDEERYGPDHFEVTTILVNLGNAYSALGDPQKKKELLERALSIDKKHYGPDHFEVAKILVNLGSAYGALGNPQKQKELLGQALPILEKHYSPDHFEVAKTLINLGNAYGDLGDHHKQKELLERALSIDEKHYGPDHFEVATVLLNLSNAYGGLDDYEKQKELLKRALSIDEKHYGPDHFEIARVLTNLGNVYSALGDHEKKKELFEQALTIKERHYGSYHFEVARILVNLGNAYGDLGNHQKQKKLLERALPIFEKHYGPNNFETARAIANLGVAYGDLGNTKKQKELLEQALTIQEKYYGPEHFEVARTLENLGVAYGDLGSHEKKKKLLEQALTIQEKYHDSSHFEVARILVNLGNAYGDLGNHQKQKELLERALLVFEKHYGPDSSEVAIALVNLGNAYSALGNSEKQKELLKLALPIFEKCYGNNHPYTLQVRNKYRPSELGECLPSTSRDRKKREVKECELLWEDVDEFNEEKEESRDFNKIRINSDKFIDYMKSESMSEAKLAQLIQLADKVQVTGESQDLVSKLINNQKAINHLAKVGRVSGMVMHGMMAKNVVADFLNGDYQGVAINLGFIAGGQGFARVAQAASVKGAGLVSDGKLFLGRSLKAASPFLARGTSAFVAYDLVNQIKEYKKGNKDALVGIVGDSIYLGVDSAEIGIEIAEAFAVFEGVSSVTGPIGAAIGAVVFVGTDVYMAVKRVDKIDQLIHLTGKEKFIEGLRAFIGMQPENHIQELLQEKEVSNELVRQGLEYLNKHSDIQSYVFPTGKSVVDSCRKVPYQVSDCASGGFGGGCLRGSTVTRYAEECTTKFEVDLDNKVILDKKRTDIKWSRARPDNPSSGKLFCLPRGNNEPVPNYGSYLCENAIGLSTEKKENYTLIDLGKGDDYSKGFLNSPNIFVVNNGSKEYYGGNKDDIFVLQAGYVKGYLSGEGGINTLDTTSFAFQEEPLNIQLDIGEIVDYSRDNWLRVCDINKVIGRKNRAETITVSCNGCNSNVKLIDGQSGNKEIKDKINIVDNHCSYQMQVIVRPNTVIYNRALEGNFDYLVPLNEGGSAEFIFIFGPERFNVNNTFWFGYEPVDIKSINVRYVNIFNRTEHEVKFNFIKSEKEFNVTIPYAENPSYRLGKNGEIKIGNKDNLYMLQSSNESSEEIIKNYLPLASRLNKMSFFIQSLLSNETVVIGSGNHEVIHNNPAYRSHLVGNGGENVYVIDSESKKFEVAIPEVIIYDLDIESSVDTIDLRNLVRQVRGKLSNQDHFQLKVLKSANDLLLKATIVEVKPTEDSSVSKMRKHEYCTVRLKDGVNWYNKTHVIVDNAPMKINLDNNEWSLKPLPLKFEKDKEVIIVTSQDIEENTELITPKRAGNYSFVSDHGNDLIVTNAFDVNVAKNDLCTIVLSKFYEKPKMATLSIKFADKEIILKEHQEEISTARDVNVMKKEHKDQVYNGVFNHTKSSPEVIMLSDQPVTHRHRHSGHREQTRHRRSTSSGIRPTGWINDLFGWVRSSISGLLSSKPESTPSSISQVDARVDVNGTIMLLDVFIRKVTGQKYVSTVDHSISPLEAQGYALNITNRFEKVLNKTAIKSGISVTNLNFDPVVVQSAIIEKIINGKFSEIAKTLYSFAKEACPEFKQTDKFLDNLKSNLEEVLAKEETMILQQKVEKPYKDLSQEVSRKVQLSKKPDTFLNGTSVVQGISRAIN
ncbi:ankyrin repeat domain-containing protein [Wolbachia endosymbiont (group B) of Archips podanus]|uniref:ankyrin repeat domain-containing protein n=1 Tax=Wolbachia endosymbiont (group B) of Archips podanus TaxID=2953984 RepID=UPI0022260F22|nr:ankyrin repeat domain-containing protein [Wolbachia endosymbiont (group B) of Archips podanus]